jgi:predicted DNA-binding transcriptional regulator YafY
MIKRTTVTVAVSDQFLGWIAALGGDVRIVAPDSVVTKMRELIEKIAVQYSL